MSGPPGVSKYLGRLRKRLSCIITLKHSIPISPSPSGAWRSLREPSSFIESFTWSAKRCSKPTILLDFSFSDLDDKYKYKWIYETKGFSLADYITKGYIGEGTNTISSIFNQLESNYEQICKHSFEYFDKNHNIKKIINDFIIYLDDASCSWGDLDDLGILYKGIIYKIYRNKGIFRKKGKQ